MRAICREHDQVESGSSLKAKAKCDESTNVNGKAVGREHDQLE